eukprot:421852_1
MSSISDWQCARCKTQNVFCEKCVVCACPHPKQTCSACTLVNTYNATECELCQTPFEDTINIISMLHSKSFSPPLMESKHNASDPMLQDKEEEEDDEWMNFTQYDDSHAKNDSIENTNNIPPNPASETTDHLNDMNVDKHDHDLQHTLNISQTQYEKEQGLRDLRRMSSQYDEEALLKHAFEASLIDTNNNNNDDTIMGDYTDLFAGYSDSNHNHKVQMPSFQTHGTVEGVDRFDVRPLSMREDSLKQLQNEGNDATDQWTIRWDEAVVPVEKKKKKKKKKVRTEEEDVPTDVAMLNCESFDDEEDTAGGIDFALPVATTAGDTAGFNDENTPKLTTESRVAPGGGKGDPFDEENARKHTIDFRNKFDFFEDQKTCTSTTNPIGLQNELPDTAANERTDKRVVKPFLINATDETKKLSGGGTVSLKKMYQEWQRIFKKYETAAKEEEDEEEEQESEDIGHIDDLIESTHIINHGPIFRMNINHGLYWYQSHTACYSDCHFMMNATAKEFKSMTASMASNRLRDLISKLNPKLNSCKIGCKADMRKVLVSFRSKWQWESLLKEKAELSAFEMERKRALEMERKRDGLEMERKRDELEGQCKEQKEIADKKKQVDDLTTQNAQQQDKKNALEIELNSNGLKTDKDALEEQIVAARKKAQSHPSEIEFIRTEYRRTNRWCDTLYHTLCINSAVLSEDCFWQEYGPEDTHQKASMAIEDDQSASVCLDSEKVIVADLHQEEFEDLKGQILSQQRDQTTDKIGANDTIDTLDNNNDGQLTAKELSEACGISEVQARNIIQQYDVDGDGSLDPQEFETLKQQVLKQQREKAASNINNYSDMNAMDDNKDGLVSASELAQACNISQKEAELLIQQYDKNGGGFLNQQEFETLKQSILKEQREKERLKQIQKNRQLRQQQQQQYGDQDSKPQEFKHKWKESMVIEDDQCASVCLDSEKVIVADLHQEEFEDLKGQILSQQRDQTTDKIGANDTIDTLDNNNDGQLTAKELSEACGISEVQAKNIIQQYDVDGDGMLDPQEFETLKQQVLKQQREKVSSNLSNNSDMNAMDDNKGGSVSASELAHACNISQK